MSFPQARAWMPQFPPRCDAARFSFAMSRLAAVAGFTKSEEKAKQAQKCHFGAIFAPFLACFSPCFGVQMSLSPLLPSAGVHFFLKIKNLRLHAESSTRGLGMAIVEIQTGYYRSPRPQWLALPPQRGSLPAPPEIARRDFGAKVSDSATPYSQSRDRTAAPRRPARPTVATWGAWWRRQCRAPAQRGRA